MQFKVKGKIMKNEMHHRKEFWYKGIRNIHHEGVQENIDSIECK